MGLRPWGYDHMLLNGLRKNDGEFGLILMSYNLRRIFNILVADKVKPGKRCAFSIFCPLAVYSVY
jgi:hypothetical protein